MTPHDLDILSRTIYGEARGEPAEGKAAVGRVIINRWQSGKWFAGKTIAETCLKPWQFSCWNANDPNRAKLLAVSKDKPSMRNCIRAAEAAEKGDGPEWLVGCTHYHTAAVKPKWADGQEPAGQIGAHLFYRNIN
jgi:N-acetylmuramoyl-L-alanine amidase